MDNNNIKNKVEMELLINEFITAEGTPEATDLKKELILTLINNKMTYVNVISYYYDILNLQGK